MNEMTDKDYKNLLAAIFRSVRKFGGTKEDAQDIFHEAVLKALMVVTTLVSGFIWVPTLHRILLSTVA